MDNQKKNQQGSSDQNDQRFNRNAGGQSNESSERPDFAEKDRPGYDVDPNKEDPTQKQAGGSQRQGQGGGYGGQPPHSERDPSQSRDIKDQPPPRKGP
jgi:hypothetical protein